MEKRIFEVLNKSGRTIYLTKRGRTHLKKHPGMPYDLYKIEETLQIPTFRKRAEKQK